MRGRAAAGFRFLQGNWSSDYRCRWQKSPFGPAASLTRRAIFPSAVGEDRKRAKKNPPITGRIFKIGIDLLLRALGQLPSAQPGLTTLFGMGRGGPRRYRHHKTGRIEYWVLRFETTVWSLYSILISQICIKQIEKRHKKDLFESLRAISITWL